MRTLLAWSAECCQASKRTCFVLKLAGRQLCSLLCWRQAGMSPTYTLTEDFALGMAMKKTGWQCRYVQEYCALGEAPEQVRNCYQQRSRWCKVLLPF